MRQNSLIIFVGVVFATGINMNASCADERDQKAHFYIAGMEALRENIRSGRVECKGMRIFQGTRPGETGISQSIGIESVFDGSAVRFDRIEDQKDSKTIISDDTVSVYSPDQNVVVKRNIDQLPANPQTAAFDVRNLGQMAVEELELGLSLDWLKSLLKTATIVDVHEEDGVCKLTWEYTNPFPNMKAQIRRTVWIDSRRGFAPVKVEMRASTSQAHWESVPPISSAEVKWAEESGIWVPIACQMKTAYGEISVELQLDWKEINGSIPSKEFLISSMNPRNQTLVIDERLGTPILESVIRKPDSGPDGLSGSRSFSLLLIAANIILIAALAVFIYIRRSQHRSLQ